MTNPNWGLMNPNASQNALAQGLAFGQQVSQRPEQKEQRNALAAFATNPNDQTAAGVAPYNPQLAYKYTQDQRAAAAETELQGIAQRAVNGDNEALGQLFVRKPDLWARLDDRTKEQTKTATSFMAQSAMQIGRLPPEQRAQAWMQSVAAAEQSGIDIPDYMEAYSEDVLNGALARAEMTEKYIKQFEPDWKAVPQGGYLEDVNPLTNPNIGQARQPVQIQDASGYEAIPPGAQYIDPQGNLRVKGGTAGNSGGGFQGP